MSEAAAPSRPRAGLVARLLALPIRGWRVLSTRLPSRCRFYPSCSAYALEALERHGAARGTLLAARRVGRCHPWNPGGLDPVPEPRPRRAGPHTAGPHTSGPPPVGPRANVRSPHDTTTSAEAV